MAAKKAVSAKFYGTGRRKSSINLNFIDEKDRIFVVE